MSYHVFFGFSTGLAHALRVPLGTRQALIGHVEAIEARLDLKRTRYEDNPGALGPIRHGEDRRRDRV